MNAEPDEREWWAAREIKHLRAINAELLAGLEDIEGKCADSIGGRINYRAGDLQIIARAAIAKAKP